MVVLEEERRRRPLLAPSSIPPWVVFAIVVSHWHLLPIT
jgi:hypothetical protein